MQKVGGGGIYYTALKRLQSRLLNKYGDFNCVDIM